MKNAIDNTDNHSYTLSSGVPIAKEAVLKLYNPKIPLKA